MDNSSLGILIKTLIPNIEERIIKKIENSNLGDRELKILKYRLIDELTLEQVGDLLGFTRERIRQIEAKAYRKLRHPSKRFSDILETKDIEYYKNLMNEFFETVEINVNKVEKLEDSDTDLLQEIPIEDLNLTLRTYNCLKRAGINNVYDLQNYSITDIKKIKNLGKKSLEELLDKLENIPFFIFKKEVEDE